MITLIKMKINEWKVKSMFYGTIVSVMNENKDIIELVQRLYLVSKDVPMEDLRKELIHNIALLAHEEGNKMREAEAEKSA